MTYIWHAHTSRNTNDSHFPFYFKITIHKMVSTWVEENVQFPFRAVVVASCCSLGFIPHPLCEMLERLVDRLNVLHPDMCCCFLQRNSSVLSFVWRFIHVILFYYAVTAALTDQLVQSFLRMVDTALIKQLIVPMTETASADNVHWPFDKRRLKVVLPPCCHF